MNMPIGAPHLDGVVIFKCRRCKNNRPHRILDRHVYQDELLYLLMCENCEDGNIMRASEELKELWVDLQLCKCGKYKLGEQVCLQCKLNEGAQNERFEKARTRVGGCECNRRGCEGCERPA